MRRPRTSGDERGAVLIELAMIVPLLILIVLGMLEMGLAWRDSVNVTHASRQGARVASNLGDDPQADLQALLNVMTVMEADANRVEYVVIYDASGVGTVPVACHSGSQPGVCNHYSAAQLANLTTNPPTNTNLFQCNPTPTTPTAIVRWCPASRSTDFTSPDHVGVYLKVDRPWATNIFPGDGTTLSGYTVMQLEPPAP